MRYNFECGTVSMDKHIGKKLQQLVLVFLLLGTFTTHGQSDDFREVATENLQQKRMRLDKTLVSGYDKAKQNPDEGLRLLMKVFHESKQINYSYGMAKALINCSSVYTNIRQDNQMDKAIFYLRNARPYLKDATARDNKITELWMSCMGTAFSRNSELDSAAYYIVAALDIALRENNTNKTTLAQRYINLAAVYYELRQFDKVKEYARQAEKIAIESKLNKKLHAIYMITAGSYLETDELDTSLKYLALASAVDYKPEDYDIRWYHELKGSVFLKKGMHQEALLQYKQAIAANAGPSPVALRGLGCCYQMFKDYTAAEHYFLLARKEVMILNNSPGFLIDVTNDLADLYDTVKNFKSAYSYRSEAYRLLQERDSKDKVEIISKLESRYKNAEKVKQLAEKQVQLMAARSQINKQYFWTAGTAVLALLAIITIIALYQKQKLQKTKTNALQQYQEIEKLQAAIEAEERERSRIGRQLHDDIMVQLSIVKMNMEAFSFPNASDPDIQNFQSIKDQLDMAGRDLRLTAHNLAPDTLLADGLTQALLYFCKNVQYRTNLTINFQFYGDQPDLPQELEINIYRISQELVQNIIKHARATNVLMQLNYREDMLTLTIEDDGIGFDMNASVSGIGLKSIRSRLKVMNGQIDIHRRHPKGTSVTIEVFK